MPISKREARELMSRGYEVEATVLNGVVEQQPDGTWRIAERSVDDLLRDLEGSEIVVVAAKVGEGAGVRHTCRTCGTEYTGHECPRCREVHRRLRGGR
jgi:hypothetical protein